MLSAEMIKKTTKNEPMAEAIRILGSQSAIAELLGVPKSTVSYWSRVGLPAEQAVALEKATEGMVPRWLVRPDLWEQPNV